MINIRKTVFTAFTENNRSRVIAEIYVDSPDELPGKDSVDGLEFVQSSIAYVISTGEIYVLGNNGKWYNSNT